MCTLTLLPISPFLFQREIAEGLKSDGKVLFGCSSKDLNSLPFYTHTGESSYYMYGGCWLLLAITFKQALRLLHNLPSFMPAFAAAGKCSL
jgi:hypothetical protein